MRISVDESRCCAAGHCALAAPEVFDQDEDNGVVVVLLDEPPAEFEDAARDAARRCPAAVIKIDA